MLDPNEQMQAGAQYTHHLNVFSIGRWNSQEITDTLSGDDNFSGVSANLTHAGLFNSTVDVTFTYAGKGSTVGQNGQEAASVLSNGFFNSSFSWAGTDQGVTAAIPDSQSDIAFYVIGGLLILVGLIVVTRFLHEVKE